jgi:hypothetical protein
MAPDPAPVISLDDDWADRYVPEPDPWRCFCVGDFWGFGTVRGGTFQRRIPISYLVEVDGGATLTVPAAYVRPAENVRQFKV